MDIQTALTMRDEAERLFLFSQGSAIISDAFSAATGALAWVWQNYVGVGLGSDGDEWYPRVYLAAAVPPIFEELLNHFPAWANVKTVVSGRFVGLGGTPGVVSLPIVAVGSSVHQDGGEQGTLCAFVKDGGDTLALSCWHIFKGPKMTPVHSGPVPIGAVHRTAQVTPELSPGISNDGDWALAKLGPAPDLNLPNQMGHLAPDPLVHIQRGMSVKKASRRPPRNGRIFDLQANLVVTFGDPDVKHRFHDQLLIESDDDPSEHFAVETESGTLVVDESATPKAVGMLFCKGVISEGVFMGSRRLTGAFPLHRLVGPGRDFQLKT